MSEVYLCRHGHSPNDKNHICGDVLAYHRTKADEGAGA